MHPDQIVSNALATGAISKASGNEADALRMKAQRDPAAAAQFASTSRTRLERLALVMSCNSTYVSVDQARAATRKATLNGHRKTDAEIDEMLFRYFQV